MTRGSLADFGAYLRRRRVAQGSRNRADFARQLGLRNDRILNDVENGARGNYSPDTLARIDMWYGLVAGTAARAIKEGEWDEQEAASIGADEPNGLPRESDPAGSVPVIDEREGLKSGRNVVRVRFAALGVEVETTYTDGEDRAQVLAEIMHSVGLNGEIDAQGGDRPQRDG